MLAFEALEHGDVDPGKDQPSVWEYVAVAEVRRENFYARRLLYVTPAIMDKQEQIVYRASDSGAY